MGAAEIQFVRRRGATHVAHLYQHEPLRVLFPLAEPGDATLAVLVTTSGGLVAGDRLTIALGAGSGVVAHLTASAAEKVYRSTGATTSIRQEIAVETGAWLEYLPPETILFDGARLRRHTRLALAPGAGFLGGGILVFGRRARAESFTHGLLHERWEVHRGGDLGWGDGLHLDGDIAALLANPACFAGAAACATLLLAPPGNNPEAFVDAAREVQQSALARTAGVPSASYPIAGDLGALLRVGLTAVNGMLVARWLGDPLPLRRAFADLACHLRQAAMGLPPRLPRLWHV